MARDNLDQLGKSFRGNFDQVHHTTRRVAEDYPANEHSLDVVAPTFPYNLEFKTYHNKHNNVTLHLRLMDQFDLNAVQPLLDIPISITETGLTVGNTGNVGSPNVWYALAYLGDLNFAIGDVFTVVFNISTHLSNTSEYKVVFDGGGVDLTSVTTVASTTVTVPLVRSNVISPPNTILHDAYIYSRVTSISTAGWIFYSAYTVFKNGAVYTPTQSGLTSNTGNVPPPGSNGGTGGGPTAPPPTPPPPPPPGSGGGGTTNPPPPPPPPTPPPGSTGPPTGGGTVPPPPSSSWMTTGITTGSFSGWPKAIPSPLGSGTTRTWTGSTSLQSFFSSLNPGDVGILDHTGTVSGNLSLSMPTATLATRIYVVNAPGKRPVGSGLMRIGGGSYYSIFGLNWTTNGSVTSGDHMVKLDNGDHWEWGCNEVWGGACYTEVRPGQTATNWRITTSYIHDNPGPHTTANQDHLIYADPGSYNSYGLIERCLLINSPHGRGVKIGGPSAGGPAIGGITVSYNTFYNNQGPSNVQVSNGARGCVVDHNVMQLSSSYNVTRGGGLLAGAGNVAKNNIGWDSSGVGEFDASTLLDGGGNLYSNPSLNLSTFVASAPGASGKGHLG